MEARQRLVAVKLAHTAVWAVFAGCTLAIPVAAQWGRFDWGLACSAAMWVECGVLVWNRMRCPLTDVAAQYTEDRADNFDIYLPLWLARHNKTIFGTIFVLGELWLARMWWVSGR